MPAEPAILVVDDELATRIALRKVLSGAGYRVIEASSGAEALDRMSTQNAPRPSRALAVDPPQCRAVGKHPAKAVMGDCQAAAAGVSRYFQCQGSNSYSCDAG